MAVSNTIKVTITGDAKQLVAAAKEAGASIQSVEAKSSSAGSIAKKAFAGIAAAAVTAFTAASAAAVSFTKSSINTGMEFDSSMSQVVATMGYSVEELQDASSEAAKTYQELRDFAQEMGSTTVFSATQASEALNYMALAGYDAQTSMQMLPNVLNLAAAGSMELATASDMVTDAQTALGLTLEETNVMVDQMATTASNSNTSVSQLGEAILTVGGTAQYMAGGTEELNTVLGVLADNGIKGSEAGTHLRNMLLKLSSPTEDAQKLLKQLGVEVFDAEGNMRSFSEIFPELNSAMANFTDEQKIDAFSTLFDTRDIASATALLNTTTQRWDELGNSILDSAGAAEKMAAVQLDNLEGDVTLFKSALEGAQIALSDELTPTLREFVQIGSSGLSQITTAFKENGFAGALSAVRDVLGQLLNKVVDILPDVISVITEIVNAVIDILPNLLISVLPPLFEAIMTVITSLVNYIPEILQALITMIISIVDGIIAQLPTISAQIVTAIMGIVEVLTRPENLQAILQAAFKLLVAMVDAIPKVITALIAALPDIITNIVTFLLDPANLMMIIDAAIQLFFGLVAAVPQILGALLEAFGSLVGNLWEGIKNMFGNFAANFGEFISGIFKNAINGMIQFIENFINVPIHLINGFLDIINGAFGWLGVNIGHIGLIQLPRLESGGIIPGTSYSGDRQLARVNSGEMVINRSQQAALWNAIESGNFASEDGSSVTMGDIIVNVNVQSSSDPQEIGQETAIATVKAIRSAFKAQGVEPLIANAGELR